MGGGNDNASRAAEQQERQRTAAIAAGTGRVNRIFDSAERQGQIEQFTQAVRSEYMQQLQEQKGKSDLQLKFAMARQGQTGGSLDVDKRRESGEAYQSGVIQAERGAQSQAADLRASDEDARARLIQQVQSGLDATTATTNSQTMLRNNLLAGQSTMNAKMFDDAFSNFADVYRRSKDTSEYRRGLRDYGNLYSSPGWGSWGGKP